MSDLAEVVAAIRDAVGIDPTIAAWCQQKYGKQYKVFVGIDDEKPPAQEDYPLIGIEPAGHAWGIKSRTESSRVLITCGIVQPNLVTSGNVVELAGTVEAEAFRRLVEERLFKAGLLVAESEAESMSCCFFPVFETWTVVTIETKLSSRRPTAG